MKKIINVLAVCLLVVGCSVEKDNTVSSEKVYEIIASYSDDATKTYIDGLNVSWSEADAIGVYDNASTPTKAQFTLSSGATTKTAYFTGAFSGDGERTICAVSPYSAGTIASDNTTYTFDLPQNQMQNGASDAIGYGRYGYMVASPVTVDPASTSPVLNFNHIMTFLTFNFSGLGDNDKILSVELKAASEVIPSKATLDISSGAYALTTTATTDHITTYVANPTTSLSAVNMAMFPINSDVAKTVIVKVDNNGTVRTLNKAIGALRNSASKGYVAGERFTINVNLSSATVSDPETWSTWDGTTPVSAPDTYVESGDEITLGGADALAYFASLVNGGNNFSGKTVSLAANIDLSGEKSAEGTWSGTNWIMIGSSSTSFSGTFDGNGYKIRNLYSNPAEVGAETIYSAFFGAVDGGTVKNVIIESGYVFGKTNTTSKAGCAYVGGICAVAKGAGTSFINCVNGADVYGVTVSYASSATACVGGIVGFEFATSGADYSTNFISCVNYGSINGTSGYCAYVGGIAGRLQHTLTFIDCVNNGAITGAQTYNFSGVKSSGGVCLGGIAGGANTAAGTGGDTNYTASYSFYSCINNANVTGTLTAPTKVTKKNAGICGGGVYEAGVYSEIACKNNGTID